MKKNIKLLWAKILSLKLIKHNHDWKSGNIFVKGEQAELIIVFDLWNNSNSKYEILPSVSYIGGNGFYIQFEFLKSSIQIQYINDLFIMMPE